MHDHDNTARRWDNDKDMEWDMENGVKWLYEMDEKGNMIS